MNINRYAAYVFIAVLAVFAAAATLHSPRVEAATETDQQAQEQKPESTNLETTGRTEQEAKDQSKTLAENLDAVISRINSLIEASLFWSVTGDAIQKTEFTNVMGVTKYAISDKGQVGDRTGTITDLPAGRIRPNKDGLFVDEQGRPVVVMSPDGLPLLIARSDGRVVDAAGNPFTITTDQKKQLPVWFKNGNAVSQENERESKQVSLLTAENAVVLNFPVRGRFEDAEGRTAHGLGPDGKIRDWRGQPNDIPGRMVELNDQEIFVDANGRPVVVMDKQGQPLAVADAEGRIIHLSGAPLTFFTKDGTQTEVRFKAGWVVNPDNKPVSLLHAKNLSFKDGLQQVSRITALEHRRSTVKIPFLIVVLVMGAIFFTFWYRWINVRGLKHCLDVICGKFDRSEDTGEISHFRALTSALSATIGLGNIAGVAIAIQVGGPGAVFWMWVMAVFGMSAKFSSCTLSQLYRQVNPDKSISGGPMYYLDLGLRAKGLGPLGKILGVMFALMVMGGALGGGNMFQANQSFMAFSSVFGIPDAGKYVFGIIMAALVGVVILGGIKRIALATSRIVPAMCGLYVLASIFIIVANINQVPQTFALIFNMAFTNNAFLGGMFGVLIMGVQRAAFSNEAGLGSAAIAHAAAKTDEPVREGIVAMIGPFIDTIIICSMTALVVIITGMWTNPEVGTGAGNPGVALTVEAFRSAIPYSHFVLTICIVLFAYSTMISWCYYGERGWIYLLDHAGEGQGLKSVIVFRVLFVVCVFVGSVVTLGAVLGFSDLMILCMAFPNIVGSIILAPHVLAKVKDYWGRYTSGQMQALR